MTTVTSENLLEFLKAYFESLGLGADAGAYFTARNFTDGLVLKLPAVCLVPGNKPANSRSKQTHIHVTGNNRYFFFDRDAVNHAEQSSEDHPQPVEVSMQNVKALSGKPVTGQSLDFQPSFTMTKIACRKSQESQVQISKLRQDEDTFISLRKCLYENDLLIFLKRRDGEGMAAIGIPRSFYEGRYSFQGDLYTGLESKGVITVKNALAAVMDAYGDADVVENEEPITDAVYQEMVNASAAVTIRYEPVTYVPAGSGKAASTKRPPTNPAFGKAVILQNQFHCAVDEKHPTFLKKDGERYLEVHHLIPLEWQDAFPYKLDTPANLIPLCPLCHRQLHYGKMEDIQPILIGLYQERAAVLQQSGLEITLETLLRFYE